jgi:hypothetical protein
MAMRLPGPDQKAGYRRKAASASAAKLPVQSVGRPLRHLVVYGSTNKYKSVSRREDEREHRQEAQPIGILLLCHGDDVDDDGRRKSHGQPAVDLPNSFVPVQEDLF